MTPLTIEQAKTLRKYDTIYEIGKFNTDGSSRSWKLLSDPKVWKRDPSRIELSLKYGLYVFIRIYEIDLCWFSLESKPSR